MTHLLLSSSSVEIAGEGLIVFGLAGLIYVYIGYPCFLWTLSRFRVSARAGSSDEIGITMIIAAHNEGESLREKLNQTLKLDYPHERLQIVVASDGSTDSTNSIVTSFASQGVELVVIEECKGKTNAQNIAVKSARNPILVFSDATTIYDGQALKYLAGSYSDPRIGAVSGRYDYIDSSEKSPSASGSRSMWNCENLIKRMQSRLGTLTGCSGCIYSIRRDLYTELDPAIISDLVQPLYVVLQGYRVVFQESARAWEESTRTAGDEHRMRVRVAVRGMIGLLSVKSLLIPWRHPAAAFQLWSHKVLRWCTPVFLIALLFGSIACKSHVACSVFLLLQLLFYFIALVSTVFAPFRRSRLASIPLYFCTLNSAFVVGMFQLICGRHYSTWKPVRG